MNRAIVIAGAAALAGVYARMQVSRARQTHPPRGRLVNGLHCIEAGAGEAVVLLHGLGSLLEDFESSGVVERASREFRVLLFDRPGHGYSARPRGRPLTPFLQARLLHGALEKLGIARPVIAAHSLGTLVAIAYALQYPGEVRGLVLASGYYYPSARLDTPILIPPAIPLVGALLRHTISPLLARLLWPAWIKILFSPLPVAGRFRRHLPVWRALQPTQLHSVGQESAMLLPVVAAMRARYGELALPVAIVAGAEDRYVSIGAHSRRLHEALPHSTYTEVAGAGHMVHHAAPEVMLNAIAAVSAGGTRASMPSRP